MELVGSAKDSNSFRWVLAEVKRVRMSFSLFASMVIFHRQEIL